MAVACPRLNTVAEADTFSVLALKYIRQGAQHSHTTTQRSPSHTANSTANARQTFDLPDCVIVTG